MTRTANSAVIASKSARGSAGRSKSTPSTASSATPAAASAPVLERIVLVVPFDPHRTSPNRRHHWRALAGLKKTFRRATIAAWRMAGSPTVPPTAKVRLSFLVRRGRRLDHDNIIASMKSSVDQTIACIGLPNDGPEHVTIGSVTQETGKRWQGAAAHVELWIEPEETA